MTTTTERLIAEHIRDMRRANARPDTISHRWHTLRRANAAMAGELVDADRETLWAWQDNLRSRLAVASVRSYSSHVRAFFAWAVREGHLDRDPSTELKPPKVPTGRAVPITEDRLRVALACAPDTQARPLRTWLVLAAYCGLRAGEIARLTGASIGDETLDVDGKGGVPRTVPLPAPVRTLLLAHAHGPGPVWRHRSGRPLTPHDVSMDCSVHLRGCGAECSLHKLRHRYATRIYKLSKDPLLVQTLLGHASLSTTQQYLATAAERGQGVADRLAESLTQDPDGRQRRTRRRPGPGEAA